MAEKIADILQERAALVKKGQDIVKLADDAKREMTAEENATFDKIMADVDAMQVRVDKVTKDQERRAKLNSLVASAEQPLRTGIIEDIGIESRDRMRQSIRTFNDRSLGGGVADRAASNADEIRSMPDGSVFNYHNQSIKVDQKYRNWFNQFMASTENNGAMIKAEMQRALQMDVDTGGGYTVVPQQFVAELIEFLKAITFFRTIAKQYLVPGAESLGAPALAARPADPTWTAELSFGNADTTMAFGKRELHPHPLAQNILVSKKLIRASALNVDQVVRDQLAYKIAIVEETAFLLGTGANQPLGCFVASNYGIDTSRDIGSGFNTTTSITADGLIEAKYNLRPVYWSRSKWIFHYSAIKNIRKLRGNDGDFLWKAGLSNDRGDTILDCPVLVSEFAPSTFTTGQYVGILGDFDFYYIADALDVTIQVLTELYALSNQNAYLIRKETDGMPVLAEAFVRVTLS